MGTPLIATSASPALSNVTEATSVGLPRRHRKKRAAKSHGNAVWVDKADEESQPNEGDNITAQSLLSPTRDMTGAQLSDSPAVGGTEIQTPKVNKEYKESVPMAAPPSNLPTMDHMESTTSEMTQYDHPVNSSFDA